MNPAVWTALQPILAQGARDVLRTLGMFLATHGVITNGGPGTEAFIGAGMTLLGIAWGWWTTSGYIQVGVLLKKLTNRQTVEAAKTVATNTTKTVGALLFAVIIASLLMRPDLAHAAGKVTKAQATSNPISVLQAFTVTDLQNALADAQAQSPPDVTAATCYTALIPIVQAGIGNPLPKGPGAFQALQKARDAKAFLANLQSPNGPLAALNIACAPLVLDAQNTLIQLGILGGGVIATSGLTLPIALPFLP